MDRSVRSRVATSELSSYLSSRRKRVPNGAHPMTKPHRSFSTTTIVAAALVVIAIAPPTARAAGEAHRGTIQIEYEVPKDATLQTTYDRVKKANALEMLRLIFISFRLPEDLYIKVVSCNGIPNAYFSREDEKPTIRICYEYLHAVYEMLPKETTAEGITPREA